MQTILYLNYVSKKPWRSFHLRLSFLEITTSLFCKELKFTAEHLSFDLFFFTTNKRKSSWQRLASAHPSTHSSFFKVTISVWQMNHTRTLMLMQRKAEEREWMGLRWKPSGKMRGNTEAPACWDDLCSKEWGAVCLKIGRGAVLVMRHNI